MKESSNRLFPPWRDRPRGTPIPLPEDTLTRELQYILDTRGQGENTCPIPHRLSDPLDEGKDIGYIGGPMPFGDGIGTAIRSVMDGDEVSRLDEV